ncbi:MAG: DUF4411 family protein [Thermoanaerobaculia bacterium]
MFPNVTIERRPPSGRPTTSITSRVARAETTTTLKARLLGKPVADPFLIAAAKVLDGCVVTEESFPPNAARIPNVCEHFGIDWTNFEGFLERNGWTF